MKTKVKNWHVLSIAAVLLFASAAASAEESPAWAYEQLLSPWYAAFNNQDAKSLADLYTADAEVGDAKGRKQIIANFKSQWAETDISCSGGYDGFQIIGGLATSWGHDTCTETPKSGGESQTIQNRWIAVYERQPDGTWLCGRDFGLTVQYTSGFLPSLGNWEVEEEHRNGPNASWVKATSNWGVKPMPGNHFVDTSGSRSFSTGEVVSWIEVWGVNPSTNRSFEYFVDSSGALGNGSFEWIGRTWQSSVDIVNADGSEVTVDCALTYNDGYNTFDGTCRGYANGKSWVSYNGKGRRID